MKHMLPQYHPNDERYSSFAPEDSCTTFTLSLRSIESSAAGSDGQRRPSFESVESWIPPELLSASSVGTMSPSTPLTGYSFNSNYAESFRSTAPHVDLQSMWNHPQDNFVHHDFGYSPAITQDHNASRYFNSYSMDVQDAPGIFHTPSCSSFSNDGISPALSRPMFSDTIPSSTALAVSSHTHWPSVTIAHTPPRTIDPSTFAPAIPNTPTANTDTPCTPSRQNMRSSVVLSSSPISDSSPGILASQHEVNDSAYFDANSLQYETADMLYEKMNIDTDMPDHHRDHSRLARRRYDRKSGGPGCKRRPLANKSGFECERVITANSFACGFPDCIDKNTGKQKRFKRAEHKKRHEKTVHQKEFHASHRCWVPQCEKAFSRTDNLKSHLRNTHGKRSVTARNRYVATLDPNNLQYYNPDWEGDLTAEGLPLRSR